MYLGSREEEYTLLTFYFRSGLEAPEVALG